MTDLRRISKEAPVPKSRLRRFIKLGVLVLIIVVLIEVWMVNSLSTSGNKIQSLENVQAELELEQELLRNQIARSNSLKVVSTQSQSLGFTEINKFEYIKQ